MPNAPLHFVDLLGLEREWLDAGVRRGRTAASRARHEGGAPRPLAGRTAALVFHKPSLRTRVSFTVGMHDLGGDVVDLSAAEVSESGRESLPDVAGVLSGMCSLIVVRTFAHRIVADAGRARDGAGDQRAHRPLAPLPDPLRPLHARARRGRDLDKHDRGVGGRRQQRAPLCGSRPRRIFGFRLNVAVPDGFGARRRAVHRGRAALEGRRAAAPATRARRCWAPTSSTPTPGPAWARRRTPIGGASCSPASGERGADVARQARTPCSCTACPRIAAKR